MLPFDMFSGRGRQRLGAPPNWSNSRHGCGLAVMQKTGQHRCAYCGVDLTHDYYSWLLLNVDHVVPKAMWDRLGIPNELGDDFSNLALACSGCNPFCNRDDYPEEAMPVGGWTDEVFFALRDRVFQKRYARIAERRMREMRFFDSRPWLQY